MFRSHFLAPQLLKSSAARPQTSTPASPTRPSHLTTLNSSPLTSTALSKSLDHPSRGARLRGTWTKRPGEGRATEAPRRSSGCSWQGRAPLEASWKGCRESCAPGTAGGAVKGAWEEAWKKLQSSRPKANGVHEHSSSLRRPKTNCVKLHQRNHRKLSQAVASD